MHSTLSCALCVLLAASFVCVADATYCRAPPDLRYGSHSGRGQRYFRPGTIVRYRCDNGYRLQGWSYTVCYYNSWKGAYWAKSAPMCIPQHRNDDDSRGDRSDDSSDSSDDSSDDSGGIVRVRCPPLQAPQNGNIRFVSTTPGSFAKYTCNPGYGLWGNIYRKCLSTGHWTGRRPTCKPQQCTELEDPENGRVNMMQGRGVGARVWYICNAGFVLVGSESRTCQRNLAWAPAAPVCRPRQCAELEDPENGRVKMMQGRGVGAEVWYICNAGFVLVGSETRTCQRNLMWTPAAPVCKPRIIRCDSLENPEFGSVRLTGTTVGSKATYSCIDGYVLEGVQFRFCQRDGEWSGEEPTCRRRIFSCGKLDNPANGGVILSGTPLGSFAKYFCNDGFVVVGFKLRRCLRDGWSGQAPICKAVDCGDLDSPTNGRVRVTGTRFGSTATYTCSPGYVLTNGNRIRECGGNGEWSGTAPSCVPIDCGPLDAPMDGSVSITATTLGSSATYGCDNGFTLQGQQMRRCQTDGRWSGSAPTCESMGQDCENLPNPENGRVVISGNTPGSTGNYSCDSGYRLVGNQVRTCQNDGEWSDSAPTCELITCPVLENPESGIVFVTGQVLDSRATYFCNVGFMLVGAVQRRCNDDGQWGEEEPQCVPVDCGNLANPRNGRVDLTGTTFRSTATYSCSNGFQLNGQEMRECQADKVWSGTTPTCERIVVDCGPLDNPENGQVNVTGTTESSTATYNCFPGYQLKGVMTRTCAADGWSGTVPTCEPIDCGPLPAPVNGEVSLTATVFESVATYSCFPGYTLQGSATRECGADAQWTGQAPTCEIVDCGPLTDPENGRVFLSSTTFRSTAQYFCNNGFFLVGVRQRECRADTTWSDEPPVCQPILCPVLVPPENSQLVVPSRTIGSVATYSCDTDFTLQGNAVRNCRPNATWDGAVPTCTRTPDCGPLTDPANGMVMVMGTTPGSKAMYSCNLGFMLQGNMTRRCQQDGQWSGNAPTCKSSNCDRLDNPANGRVVLTGTSLGDTATYSCNDGYELVGDQQRMCPMNRQWSGSEPSCRLVDCGPLDAPSNGRIDITSTTFQSMAFYSCDPGFNLVGESKRTCLASGDWSSSPPVCNVTRECSQLEDPANGQVSITGTVVDSTATYTCNQGYVLTGEATRQCLESGQWSGQAPTCKPVDCGPLSAPDNGQIQILNTTLGSPAVYSCNVGFNLVGTSRRVCTESGDWSDTAPECQPVECPALQNPANGRVNLSSVTFGSIATYECNVGYILVGDLQRTCQDNGQWSGRQPECIVRPPGCGDPGTPENGRRIGTNFTVGAVVFFRCFDDFDLVGSKFRICQENATWSGIQPVCQAFNDTCDGSKLNDAVDRCARRCQCVNGRLINCCRVRKDYVDLTREDRLAYINAFITIVFDPIYQNRYNDLIALYRASFQNNASQSTSPQNSQFFVFARYFMLEYEDILKDINCSLTIPYWDWTPFPTTPYSAAVWSNDDGFGDTSRAEDGCVITGPVRIGAFFVSPSAGSGCLRRDYRNQRFPSRDIVVRDLLPLTMNEFDEFHRFLQLFIGLNVQCFVGGTMCSSDAANDPVFLLHLAQLDSLLTRWQLLGAGRNRVRYATDNGPLIFSPGFTVAQFSSNLNLPYGNCILYDPPALLKNHAPPPVTLSSLGVPARVATMDCAPHERMEFMNMTEADDQFMEEHCSQTRVFRSVPSAKLN